MVAPGQSGVAEVIDSVVNAFGPFVIPVFLFVAGLVGYTVLVALGRVGIDPTGDARTDGAHETESGDAVEQNSAGNRESLDGTGETENADEE
jgi:hypothetical protein